MHNYKIDPKLDLVLERTLDLPVEKVWEAWTNPDHMKAWFCPKPWQLVNARLDLRPGGEFHSVMKGPNPGEEHAGTGCILEVVKNEKLIWTDCLGPDYRPNENSFFTAILLLERDGNKTKYTAIARHGNEEKKKQHEAMGFEQGWGICADQLVAHMKGI